MNPRRVHELMRRSFPELDSASATWVLAFDEDGLRTDLLRDLLSRYIPGDELLIEVHRRIGDVVTRQGAEAFVADHMGQGDIRISNRQFTGFVVVTVGGVATGWIMSGGSGVDIRSLNSAF